MNYNLRLAVKNDKSCLTTDCQVINPNDPDKFRTKAGNVKEQVYYFKMKTNYKLGNTLISKRISQTDSIDFQIDYVLRRDKKYWIKRFIESNDTTNIRPTIGRNYHKRNIADFKPKVENLEN